LAAALLGALPHLATAQVAILHIQVIEGEGAVSAPGARGTRPLAVEITDETGKPVEGAAVSFHLPEEGPGGSFANGLRTEVALTDARGRAAVRSLQFNRMPGRFQIRIVASKEQARAGTMSWQYIADTRNSTASATGRSAAPPASHHILKWVALAALAGGAAAVAAVVAGKSGGGNAAASAPATAATPASGIGIAIGGPSITVGKP